MSQSPPPLMQRQQKQQKKASEAMQDARDYKRKEKSLSLLAQRFLKLCVSFADGLVCLNETASKLGVERRRIYDVVNILESLGVVRRRGKNLYSWTGLQHMAQAVARIRTDAATSWSEDIGLLNAEVSNASFTAEREETVSSNGTRAAIGSRRSKSLSTLCSKFIRLFFVPRFNGRPVSLDDAARIQLIAEMGTLEVPTTSGCFKSRVRRLYDIANVLTALGLIEKVYKVSSRKPAFHWIADIPSDENEGLAHSSQPIHRSKSRSNQFCPSEGNSRKRDRKRDTAGSSRKASRRDSGTVGSRAKANCPSLPSLQHTRSNSLAFSFSSPTIDNNTQLPEAPRTLQRVDSNASAFTAVDSKFRSNIVMPTATTAMSRSAFDLAQVLALAETNPDLEQFLASYRAALDTWATLSCEYASVPGQNPSCNRDPVQNPPSIQH